MTYDVKKIRSHFPSLNTGLAFFCGPGGSQVPDVVGAAIAAAITQPISNRNTNTESEKNAEEIVLGFRQAVGDLIDVDPRGVVYGRSWTQLSYDFSRTLAKNWGPGDEVVVSRLDHDSNGGELPQMFPQVKTKLNNCLNINWLGYEKVLRGTP